MNIRIRELEIKLFQRDLTETNSWMDELEALNKELQMLLLIEKSVLHDEVSRYDLLAWRRINTLAVAGLCKYQQIIKKEMEYGLEGYYTTWSLNHERYRSQHKSHINRYGDFKIKTLGKLLK